GLEWKGAGAKPSGCGCNGKAFLLRKSAPPVEGRQPRKKKPEKRSPHGAGPPPPPATSPASDRDTPQLPAVRAAFPSVQRAWAHRPCAAGCKIRAAQPLIRPETVFATPTFPRPRAKRLR